MFPHCTVHKFTCTSGGKIRYQIDHILMHRRLHSSVLNVQSLMGADCDTNHCLVADKVKEQLAVSK
jgi:hypothetical protein